MEEAEGDCVCVTMRRKYNSQPWGFRMAGGRDQGCSLHIAKVCPGSLSERYGLRAGDVLLRIEQLPTHSLNHDHAKAEILRAGNDLHFMVKRGGIAGGSLPIMAEQPMEDRRSVVVEEKTAYRGDTNPTSQSRSFFLLNQLVQHEMEELPTPVKRGPRPVNGPRPISAEHGAVRGATYGSGQAPPGGTAIGPAPGPARQPGRADHVTFVPAKESMQASVAATAQVSPNRPVARAAAAPPTANKPAQPAVDTSVHVQANTSKFAPAVVPVGSEVKLPPPVAPKAAPAVAPKAAPAVAPKEAPAVAPKEAPAVAPKAQANTSNISVEAATVDVQANSSKATLEASPKVAKVESASVTAEAASVDVKGTKPGVTPEVTSVTAEAKGPEKVSATETVKVQDDSLQTTSVEGEAIISVDLSAESAQGGSEKSADIPAADESEAVISVDIPAADSADGEAIISVDISAESAEAEEVSVEIPAAVSADAEEEVSVDLPAAESADGEAVISVDLGAADVMVDAPETAPADAEAVISVDASIDSAEVEVSESVNVEGPLTVVAIASNEDDGDNYEGDYSDGDESDYSDGSVSEGSEEAEATFTIQMS